MASSSLLPQTPNGPLPEKWLKNGHLIVPELNFSIDSPALDSHWSYQELPKLQGAKETAFIVDASAERYVLIVWEKGGDDQLNEPGNRKRMWDEMQKSLPTGWQTVGEPQVAQTNVPLSRSWNVTATIRRSDGSLVQAYQYITGGKRTYIFVDYSTETTEPPRFNRFVTSFSVLSPGDNIYTPDIGLSGLFLVLFILGFGFFAPVWWFRRTRGNHPHWQKHWWAIIAGTVLLLSASGATQSRPPPADLAGRLGSITGTLILTIGGPWLIAWGIRGSRIG